MSPGGDDVSEEESTEGSSEEEEGSESDSAESTEEYGALVERLKASQSELAALQAQAQALDERNARRAPPAYGYVSCKCSSSCAAASNQQLAAMILYNSL